MFWLSSNLRSAISSRPALEVLILSPVLAGGVSLRPCERRQKLKVATRRQRVPPSAIQNPRPRLVGGNVAVDVNEWNSTNVVIIQARIIGKDITDAEQSEASTNRFQVPSGIRSMAMAVIEQRIVERDIRPAVIQFTSVMVE